MAKISDSRVKKIIYKCGKDEIVHSIDGIYEFDRIEFRNTKNMLYYPKKEMIIIIRLKHGSMLPESGQSSLIENVKRIENE